MIQLFMPFIIVIGVFYFMVIRPQQKQQKQRREMLDALKKGDRVVTIGGIYGEITLLKEDYVTLKVADKVEIKVRRSGIESVQS
ncbi:MAG TPA: preprotein translocase subunit YajC [Firmicutes bacterium]|nr:MAG: preprotein translocase subunit YajC [Peptococcaceae bacterium 1109]HHT73116.1 preprotein translocase subunit YajC [Bacillota bacterium]